MDKLADRVRQRREDAGMSQAALARLAGIKQPTVANIESGRNRGTRYIAQIAAALNVSSTWLATGKGGQQEHGAAAQRATKVCGSVVVARLSATGSMGPGHDLAESDAVIGRIELSADWIRQSLPRLSSSGNLRVISAYGDSMSPTFNDGDLLLVDAGIRAVDVDGVFVLRANGRLYVKRVRQRMDGTFEVRSDNVLAGSPEDLDGRQSVEVLGRVVWAWNGKKL